MKEEKKDLTGLSESVDFNADEYDLVNSLLEAASYREDDGQTVEIRIERNGKFLFSFRVHPISEEDIQKARQRAAVKIPNPNGKHLPRITKEINATKYNSYILYAATVDEDKEKIWGNSAIRQKYILAENAESIDVLLRSGEKAAALDVVHKISGGDADFSIEENNEEYDEFVKN